ncbi:hypothetical protein B5M09_012009 [Aphanomyces astaci]|uniref:DDE-1 domain-containing protein n=1 Tax=Aphanomyces astaci TaxID=112090 RepID=A0A3R7YFM6_APHAT|nr:hypothetical protein B5M09_012009 [Aphanomyces astaci]
MDERKNLNAFLTSINERKAAQDRNILLLVDNAPPHTLDEDTVLTNVQLKVLPPNTTTHLQPQEAGIIASFKAKVKQRQLQNALDQINMVIEGRQSGLYECAGITEEEAVKLLKAHGRALGRGRSDDDRGRGNGHRMATMKTDPVHTERVELVATVEGVLTVKASLLDSGAVFSVASVGLVSALLAAGGAPEITTMGSFSLRPYGANSRPVVVTKQVRFGSLEFKAGCGPLMLLGLRVWVDEAVVGVELTLGLPVMQKLGYSDKALLENARRQQTEWDFADQSMATRR